MKSFTFLLSLLVAISLSAQNFNGQWKGYFSARGEQGHIEYVLELNTDGNEVTGYSYTYPVFNGKKYYDICEIKGLINIKEKYIEIKEVGKIKSNVPPPYRFDCFQTHKLTYSKNNELEKLSGSWEPAVLSLAVCGSGTTFLERRRLKDIISEIRKADSAIVKKDLPKKIEKKPEIKQTPKSSPQLSTKPKPKTNNPIVTKPKPTPPVTKTEQKKEIGLKKDTSTVAKKTITHDFEKINLKPLPRFKTRTNNILKTINVSEENITVQLYDNGEIDGDTVTVTFNGEIVANKKGLNANPIILNLKVKPGIENELVMYAENLGTVPPNTALMVVRIDGKRYEVNISSDEKRNGSIIFRREN
ncbi:MAG TPA: hypothetical protein VFN30_08070 [Chitinophagaceae bacterium]|nr:hypothetical protein [Chitinophagaceae bacterium]